MQKLYKINIDGEEYTVGYPASVLVGQLEEELETLRASNTIKQANIERLEAENAKLIAERDGFEESYRNLFNKRSSRVVHLMDAVDKKLSEINCTEDIRQTVYESIRFYGCGEVADLKLKTELLEEERDALLAEREAMMKQTHKRADELLVGDHIKKYGEAIKIFQITNNGGYIKINFDETHLPPEALIEMIYGPLPAQQIPDTLSSDDFVPMPSNADQASWMMAIGESWLERNAPERLNPHRVGLHIDDFAVNQFADSMKKKLAISREKGKSGWNDPLSCKVNYLAELLISHLPKGDPVDVANFAMMLHLRDGGHDALKEAANKIKQIPEGYALEWHEVSLVVTGPDNGQGITYADETLYQFIKAMLSASQPKGDV